MPERHSSTAERQDGPRRGRLRSAAQFLEDRGAARGGNTRGGAGAARGDERRDSGASTEEQGAPTEEREVRVADPELTPETNARLTEELREVVGTDHVRVPADRPHATLGERPNRQTIGAYINQHRFQFVRGTMIMLTFGAIVSLITGNWWLLPLAAGIHALGTMMVTVTVIGMTTISEHPAPEVAAAMAEDGVANPDERFSEMVDEFRDVQERDAGDVISPGANERTADVLTDPLDAGGQQSSAITPTGAPSQPGGEGGAPDVVIWTTAIAIIIVSIVVPPFFGNGWMWLLPAVMVPLVAGWMVMQWMMITRGGKLHIESRRPLVAIVLCTAIAVAVFCGVVSIAYNTGAKPTPSRGAPINSTH